MDTSPSRGPVGKAVGVDTSPRRGPVGKEVRVDTSPSRGPVGKEVRVDTSPIPGPAGKATDCTIPTSRCDIKRLTNEGQGVREEEREMDINRREVNILRVISGLKPAEIIA
jgi:hypothetical protein